ncbi:MAG: hypothetical protein OQJ89_05660 [Kangiellaceae bacterium]|nr:hypothetical protein [Kangiellaceae bacterium]MCW8999410.1 hypothetical protein [Kangiellaceae bacterium]MCW9016429.1 hypothetical protein [Kangiellaceae bacterium]
MSLRKLSLEDLMQDKSLLPEQFQSFLDMATMESYEEFLNRLNADVDAAIADLESNRHLLQNDSEDRLSVNIISYLKAKGYNAYHDVQHGGHVDIYVDFKKFKWLGEAKIHKSYDYLMQGFDQLCTRYAEGADLNSHGGLIIYIKISKAADVVFEWKKRLESGSLDELTTTECKSKPNAFVSCHKHSTSGTFYTVRHIPVLLHFKPEDR